jgi:hypothetical protein
MLKFFHFKTQPIPDPEVPPKLLNEVELTLVHWKRRLGPWHGDAIPASKAFTSYEDAVAFSNALVEAKKLLQDTDRIDIRIEKG